VTAPIYSFSVFGAQSSGGSVGTPKTCCVCRKVFSSDYARGHNVSSGDWYCGPTCYEAVGGLYPPSVKASFEAEDAEARRFLAGTDCNDVQPDEDHE